MPLQLEIVSDHREIVGDDAVREFRNDGGTIGRSLKNDWILPDPDRYISGRHAAIDFKGGIWYLADTSSNGTYVNDEHEPIGRGNPRRLFNGDRLRMGDFEFAVIIDEGESLEMPAPPMPSVVPDNIEQLVPESTFKTGIQLLDEEEITGDEAFVSALADRSAVATHNFPLESTPKPPPRTAARRDAVDVTAADLFDTFLDGVGISRADLRSDLDMADALQNAGQVLREFLEGSNKLLASRANLKNVFKLDQTTILPQHNNPLKLSESTNDSIKQMLVGHGGEYLGPRDAVREVCRDLLFHQDAFLEAMHSALADLVERFEPDELTQVFSRSLDSKPLLGFLNKLKYWQLYCDLYPAITEKGGGRLPQIFAEQFVAAYERQIADYKRLGYGAVRGKPVPLDKTVKMPVSELHRHEVPAKS